MAKLVGGKLGVGTGEGMVNAKCIMKTKYAELLKPLNSM